VTNQSERVRMPAQGTTDLKVSTTLDVSRSSAWLTRQTAGNSLMA
jgi:hypothetical protein